MENSLPHIPAKRYFTIGEVGELCGVKPHVLRYWEQEFSQLRPMKRRGNRRYYQHHEVLMIRRIRDLLYEQGFTIVGARSRLQEWVHSDKSHTKSVPLALEGMDVRVLDDVDFNALGDPRNVNPTNDLQYPLERRPEPAIEMQEEPNTAQLRTALHEIRCLLMGFDELA